MAVAPTPPRVLPTLPATIPKIFEVPQTTGSEKQRVPIFPPDTELPGCDHSQGRVEIGKTERPPSIQKAPPRDLGRGGEQHRAIQQRVKQEAEKLGFRGVIEKQILEGQGSVDLSLERGDQVIACEISISTTIDHEVGNVLKCFKAGYPKVAIICLEEERLRKIATAVSGSLGAEAACRAMFVTPDQFLAELVTMPQPPSQNPDATQTRHGYRVKVNKVTMSPQDQKTREEEAIRLIAESMRRTL
jgi:hypothetical protein